MTSYIAKSPLGKVVQAGAMIGVGYYAITAGAQCFSCPQPTTWQAVQQFFRLSSGCNLAALCRAKLLHAMPMMSISAAAAILVKHVENAFAPLDSDPRNERFAQVTVRSASQEEKALLPHPDVTSMVTLSIPNLGNTCFAASIVQTWLLDHEGVIDAALQRLRVLGLSDVQQARRARLQELKTFITHLRENAQRLARGYQMGLPATAEDALNITPLIRCLLNVFPEFARDRNENIAEAFQKIEGNKRVYSEELQKDVQQITELQGLIDLAEGQDCQSTEDEKQKLEGNVDYYRRALEVYRQLPAPVDIHAFEKAWCAGVYDTFIPQQDPAHIVAQLYSLIHEDRPVTELHRFAVLKLGKGDILQDHDPNNCPVGRDPYRGYMTLPLRPNNTLSFSELFHQTLNCAQDNAETVRRHVRTSKGVSVEKELPYQRTFERYTTAPQQLMVTVQRFAFSMEENRVRKIADPIAGIDEIVEIPADVFLDGEAATYLLKSMVIHEGGSNALAGHYWALAKKYNQAENTWHWEVANDSTVRPLAPSAEKTAEQLALEIAGKKAYILNFAKI